MDGTQAVHPTKEPVVLRTTETAIRGTVYTVIAIQSEQATETFQEKFKRLLLRHVSDMAND